MTYIYDKATGKMKPIERRAVLERHGGPAFGALDPRDVDRAAPRAILSLTNDKQRELIKQSGFSRAHIQRTWGI